MSSDIQAGSESFKSITRTYYKGVAGVLILYDITRLDTFQHAIDWLGEVKEHGNEHICVVLAGNKSDMANEYL